MLRDSRPPPRRLFSDVCCLLDPQTHRSKDACSEEPMSDAREKCDEFVAAQNMREKIAIFMPMRFRQLISFITPCCSFPLLTFATPSAISTLLRHYFFFFFFFSMLIVFFRFISHILIFHHIFSSATRDAAMILLLPLPRHDVYRHLHHRCRVRLCAIAPMRVIAFRRCRHRTMSSRSVSPLLLCA